MKNDKTLSEKILEFLGSNKIVFYILSFTWGFLASFIGIIIIIPFLITKRVKTFSGRLYGIFPKCFGSSWGFEMGCFFFTAYDSSNDTYLNCHESGHGLQNILWGPLMLFVINIPSMIRFWYFKYLENHDKKVPEYESIWFERQATEFGKRYIYKH